MTWQNDRDLATPQKEIKMKNNKKAKYSIALILFTVINMVVCWVLNCLILQPNYNFNIILSVDNKIFIISITIIIMLSAIITISGNGKEIIKNILNSKKKMNFEKSKTPVSVYILLIANSLIYTINYIIMILANVYIQ